MKKKYTIITLVATVVLIAALAFTLVPGMGITMAQDSYVLDHFKGYSITTGSAPPIPVTNPFIVLQDQFDLRLKRWELKKVEPADMFFNPTEKTRITATGGRSYTPIADKRNHLERFPLADIAGIPAETTRWNVLAQNQFGRSQKLQLGPATHILVPTEKDDLGSPDDLDHFKWYPVIRGNSVEVKVNLKDQWGEWEDVLVLRPVAFANPVRKLHFRPDADGSVGYEAIGVKHAEAHIVAYTIEVSDPGVSYTAVIANQFVTDRVITSQEGKLLLVPSAKLHFSPILRAHLAVGTN